MPTTKELKSIIITNHDLDMVKTQVLKELKQEHTKCVDIRTANFFNDSFTYMDDTVWFLPKECTGIVILDRKERQEKMKKNHPHLYDIMKRHEAMAK